MHSKGLCNSFLCHAQRKMIHCIEKYFKIRKITYQVKNKKFLQNTVVLSISKWHWVMRVVDI